MRGKLVTLVVPALLVILFFAAGSIVLSYGKLGDMRELGKMVELAQANQIIPIVCSVLPAFDYPWSPGLQPNIKIPKLNRMLKNMASDKGAVYLDYFSKMADDRNGLPPELTTDEVHVTKAGYKIMEQMVKETIDQVLQYQ